MIYMVLGVLKSHSKAIILDQQVLIVVQINPQFGKM